LYKLYKYQGDSLIYEIRNKENTSWLRFLPEKGALITGLGIDGEELLYLEKDTSSSKYIRGGIPILFPICGRLSDGKYNWNGREYQMSIHGINKELSWEIEDIYLSGNSPSVRLRTCSNNATRTKYPFDFKLVFNYQLMGNSLVIEQNYYNLSRVEMPFYAGFHPYFKVSGKDRLEYDFSCTEYLDYSDMSIKRYMNDINMAKSSNSKILLDNKKNYIGFYDPGFKRNINIEYSNSFKYVVLWTQENKNFLCVEPWMAQPDALNTNKDLVYIKPDSQLKEKVIISYHKND